MHTETINCLKSFRERIYHFFQHRRDAALELVDSLSSNTHAKHVVELSLNGVHRRNYCSITRTLSEYYEGVDKAETHRKLTRALSSCCPELTQRDYHLFALDCTSNPRLFSRTLADRGIVHAPNPVIGNKPITVGHQYSVVVYLPEKLAGGCRPWVIPLSCERVSTADKATLLGMNQLSDCVSDTAFKERLCVNVGDSAYSHAGCITEANKNPHQMHISRAKSNRIFYDAPKASEQNHRGRPKRYGQKFVLNSDALPLFRFGKNRLLMDKLQTPKVENEEAFWQLSLIAYAQLYLSRDLAEYLPTPWGKYVDKFKSPDSQKGPTQVQNSFSRIISKIGTPTQAPKPRNKATGRKQGDIQIKRPIHKVVIKSQKTPLYAPMLM